MLAGESPPLSAPTHLPSLRLTALPPPPLPSLHLVYDTPLYDITFWLQITPLQSSARPFRDHHSLRLVGARGLLLLLPVAQARGGDPPPQKRGRALGGLMTFGA